LTAPRPLVLLTCHTPGFTPERLRAMAAEALAGTDPDRGGAAECRVAARPLTLRDVSGRQLPSGVVVRCEPA
jgi:hypothetical protein